MHIFTAHTSSSHRAPHQRWSVLVSIALVALALAACSSSVQGEVVPDPDLTPTPAPPAPTAPTAPASSTDLRGDADFVVDELQAEQAQRYEALWEDVLEAKGDLDPMRLAAADDTYHYSRTLQTYVQSVMASFRMTGDLALLDHVDEIAEVMRSKLRDEWRGTLDGTDGTRDGFLNWSYKYGNERDFEGKDTNRGNEMKAHAMIAMIAHALDVNRDLTSPGGRDYGAHADFWIDYLVNHFEAKWRERFDVETGFPILMRPHTHTYYSWMRWHYYMAQLTGDDDYLAEANRMADVLWDEVRPVETASGTAYVWARSVLAEGGTGDYLHPTTYARYVFGDAVEMHLEGFHRWASEEEMARFARTFTELVMDSSDPVRNGFASDIGGGRARAGLRSDASWPRLGIDRFRLSSYALIGAWDTSGELIEATTGIHQALAGKDTALLSAGLFVDAWRGDVAPLEIAEAD